MTRLDAPYRMTLRRLLSPAALLVTVLCIGAAGCAAGVGRTASGPARPATGNGDEMGADPFDADAAWTEFEAELRASYAYLDRADAGALFARARPLAQAADTPAAFRAVAYQTLRAFADPHLIAGPLDATDYAVVPTASDLAVGYRAGRGGRLVVLDVRAGSAADSAGIRPGWWLVAVGGRPAAEAAREPFGAVVPDPTPRQLAYGATVAAAGVWDTPRQLTFEPPAGGRREVALPPTSRFVRSLRDRPPLSVRRVECGDRAVGVVRFHSSLGDAATIAAFDAAVRDLSDADALVVDLRDTPSGGNTDVARSVIGHFVTEPRPYQVHGIPAVERATGVPRRFVELALPRAPHYAGPVVVLGGRWTGSMGEGLVVGLDAAAGALTVGSDMGDLLGALWNRTLLISGLRLDLGGEALSHPDGTPREDYAMDVPLLSADRDADGGDPALAAALDALALQDP